MIVSSNDRHNEHAEAKPQGKEVANNKFHRAVIELGQARRLKNLNVVLEE